MAQTTTEPVVRPKGKEPGAGPGEAVFQDNSARTYRLEAFRRLPAFGALSIPINEGQEDSDARDSETGFRLTSHRSRKPSR